MHQVYVGKAASQTRHFISRSMRSMRFHNVNNSCTRLKKRQSQKAASSRSINLDYGKQKAAMLDTRTVPGTYDYLVGGFRVCAGVEQFLHN